MEIIERHKTAEGYLTNWVTVFNIAEQYVFCIDESSEELYYLKLDENQSAEMFATGIVLQKSEVLPISIAPPETKKDIERILQNG